MAELPCRRSATCVIDLVEHDCRLTAAVAARDDLTRGVQRFREESPLIWAAVAGRGRNATRQTLLLPAGIGGWAGLNERPDYASGPIPA